MGSWAIEDKTCRILGYVFIKFDSLELTNSSLATSTWLPVGSSKQYPAP